MLEPDEVVAWTRDLYRRHRDELTHLDRIYGYLRGRYGVPDVPEGANDELRDIARMSVKNVLTVVRDTYVQGLTVVGYRSPEAPDNDAAIWRRWQQERLDARQMEITRAAVSYGAAYGVRMPDGIRLRSPRQMFAVYEDPHVDLWPLYALETWVDDSGPRRVRRGCLIDATHIYPVVLGALPRNVGRRDQVDDNAVSNRRVTVTIDPLEDPIEHGHRDADGIPRVPVVRFVDQRDAEDLAIGAIEPLIPNQRALNSVNFDRMVVARYGAFPQRYAIGWAPSGPSELVRASMAQLMAFEDHPSDVNVGAFPAASTEGYNAILREMLAQVALQAQVPVFSITGDVENLSAEAIAMSMTPYLLRIRSMRDSFGESWEQLMACDARMAEDTDDADPEAEVVWGDIEPRAFGAVVDGVQKLTAAGVPLEELLEDIPGWTQQRVERAKAAIRRSVGRGFLDELAAQVADPADTPEV